MKSEKKLIPNLCSGNYLTILNFFIGDKINQQTNKLFAKIETGSTWQRRCFFFKFLIKVTDVGEFL
jgi:hypothetical protein